MTEVTIRLAVPADAPQLRRMMKAQLDEHDIPVAMDGLSSAIDALLARPGQGAFVVAVSEGDLAGAACLSWGVVIEHGGIGAWLQELYVLPAHRNRGIGQRLLDAAFDVCRRHGCVAIDLEIEESHGQVENLYRRNGFRPHTRSRWFRVL